MEVPGIINFDGRTGEETKRIVISEVGKDWPGKYYEARRSELHAELRRIALLPESEGGKGSVPELLLGAKIASVDCDVGSVRLESGRTIESDLIIGADGIHSIVRLEIKPDAKLIPFGKSSYRWLMPRAPLLEEAEECRKLFASEGYFGELADNDRRIIWYPCQDNTLINVNAFLPSQESEAAGSDYNQVGGKATMQKGFHNFFSGARKALEHAPEEVKMWELYDMEPMERWYKGKLVLVGDACHPFTPFMGQGGALAIEDIMSLATLLPAGIRPDEAVRRFQLYQNCRHERASFVQDASRVNGGNTDTHPKDFNFGAAFGRSQNFNEVEHTKEQLKAWRQ